MVDQGNKEMHVFDNTVMPPKFKQAVPMSAKTHGWICFSRDGKYGWCDTGEVFDVATQEGRRPVDRASPTARAAR